MKKLIYILPLIFALNAGSQIIMDQNTFVRPEAYTLTWQTHSSPTLSIPSQGDNQTWNYSTIAHNSTFSEEFIEVTNPNFEGSLNCIDQATVDFEGLALTGIFYYAVNSEGYFQTGITANEFKENIGDAIPPPYGSENDSILFEETDILFGNPWQLAAFPSGYEDEWADTINWKADFHLKLAFLGPDPVPGYYKQTAGIMSEVVGQGTISLPNDDGTANYQALLIKTEEFRIDSFYLNDEPADASLLSLIGISQGEDTRYYSYDFFIPQMKSYSLRLFTNADYSSIIYSRFNPDFEEIYLGIEEHESEFNIYPNPVNEKLYFNTENNNSNIEIFDINGKILFQGPPTNNSIDVSQFDSGMYFLRFKTDSETKIKSFIKQ
jgi:hypothetical protein